MADDLWAISIDPDESMREYVLLQLKVRAMRDLLFRSRIFTYLTAATPGLKELVTIGKIWELTLDDRKVKGGRHYDLVIVDAPATGHGVGFCRPRGRSPTSPASARCASRPRPSTSCCETRREPASSRWRCPRRCRSTRPRRSSASSTSEVGVPVDAIVCNGVYPERFSADEVARIEAADGGDSAVDAARGAALAEARRAAAQRDQLARLEEICSAPVSSLPYLFEPELGIDAIRELSAALEI